MGPQNGIMGDDNFGTELPQTQVEDDGFAEVLKTAKFSKTAEFQQLREYLESRMDFYRAYLPDGTSILKMTNMAELGQNWVVANAIIGEFKAVIDVYEQAAKEVKDRGTSRQKTA